MKELEEFIMKSLNLQEGDIVVMEMPYEDAVESDFFPCKNDTEFEPNHTAIWVSGDKPVAHSTREGYRLPGLRLTSLSDCRATVFRFKDKAVTEQAASIMKSWSLSSTQLDLKMYLERYPKREWPDRHQRDITNFFTPDNNAVTAPATPYLESKANEDFRDLHKDASKASLSKEGMRRAIKFSARRELTDEGISKGQRCTPAVVAAFQATLLAGIVKTVNKDVSKKIKSQSFEETSQTLFKPGWEKSEIGQRLTKAMKSNDFSQLFPETLNVDQRYATPKALIQALAKDEQFEYVGQFSIFSDRVEVVDSSDKVFENSIAKLTHK